MWMIFESDSFRISTGFENNELSLASYGLLWCKFRQGPGECQRHCRRWERHHGVMMLLLG
jgi:hypothetical protein